MFGRVITNGSTCKILYISFKTKGLLRDRGYNLKFQHRRTSYHESLNEFFHDKVLCYCYGNILGKNRA